jgi:hypothetical protein
VCRVSGYIKVRHRTRPIYDIPFTKVDLTINLILIHDHTRTRYSVCQVLSKSVYSVCMKDSLSTGTLKMY